MLATSQNNDGSSSDSDHNVKSKSNTASNTKRRLLKKKVDVKSESESESEDGDAAADYSFSRGRSSRASEQTKQKSNKKLSALDRLKRKQEALKHGKSNLEIEDEEDVYEEVDEETYSKRARADAEQFVVDEHSGDEGK